MGRKPRLSQGLDLNTRDRLLNAARQEFDEKGYYLTNGDSITKRAGLGHGTFYIHFRNKNAVLIELLRQAATTMPYTLYRSDPQYFINHAVSPAKLEDMLREMLNPLSEIPGLLKALLQGMLQDEELASFGMEVGKDLARMFRIMIASQQKRGNLRGCNAKILSEIITVCLASSMLMTAYQVIPGSPEILSRNLCGMLAPVLFPDDQFPLISRRRMTRPDNEKKIRRELLDAAREEFIAHGYFETKIANVAQRSGYSRRAFYHYFKSKDELLMTLFMDILSDLYPPARSQDSLIETLDTSSMESLVHVLAMIMKAFDTPMNTAFLQGFFNSPALTQIYNDIFALYGEPISRKLIALQAAGRCHGVDPPIGAYIIVTTVSYIAYLHNAGFISGDIPACAQNLGCFLYCFVNYRKPVP